MSVFSSFLDFALAFGKLAVSDYSLMMLVVTHLKLLNALP
jgi:hypothetical protein